MSILMSFLMVVAIALVVFWAIPFFFMRGEDHSPWDGADISAWHQSFNTGSGPSEEHWQVANSPMITNVEIPRPSQTKQLEAAREQIDRLSEDLVSGGSFLPADAGGVPGEWVLDPGADPSRRLLYIHGGAFIVCSARSHRAITSKMSQITGGAVLAIDYRLMPEHRRLDGIEDCRTAYRWILENGPNGPEPLDRLFVSGDSAGGNLSLSLSAWVRDQGLRPPDAVVALSPLTDSTFSSPSMKTNIESDLMLGPAFGALSRIPRPVMAWSFVLQNRMSPANPVVSPLFGDLSGLPPTLVQASEAEMLLDDARRYVAKARGSGSEAFLQTWPHVLHVWQLFHLQLPEARHAWDEISKFLAGYGTANEHPQPHG